MVTKDLEIPGQKPDEACYPIAYKCNSYGDYKRGFCTNCTLCNCQVAALPLQLWKDLPDIPIRFGVLEKHLNDSDGFVEALQQTYYMETEIEAPYCSYTYS